MYRQLNPRLWRREKDSNSTKSLQIGSSKSTRGKIAEINKKKKNQPKVYFRVLKRIKETY